MQSKNQTDTAGSGGPSTSAQSPTPWKWYKRYSDGKKVEARLFPELHRRLMEVLESRGEDFCCPECKALISKGNGQEFPYAYLTPEVFHERHRPIDTD
jgi:hypothetical protein